MSLAYNLIKTLNLDSYNSVNPASSNVAMFFMDHPNANEEDIQEFAEKNSITIEEVNFIFIKFIRSKNIF
jgi:hypothetical protein